MAETLEIEYKTLLSAAAYHHLVTTFALAEETFFTQTNCYFDTPQGALRDKHLGLRIRLLPERAELTLKIPQREAQHTLKEITDTLTLADAEALLAAPNLAVAGDVARALAKFNLNLRDCVLTAELTTKRAEIQLDEATLLVLDHSWYHGQEDYELEMEVADAATGYQTFTTFLAAHQLPLQAGGNKIARAIRAKEG